MISIFEIFKIGVGPSSSHTVGPMKAAYEFIKSIDENGFKSSFDKVEVNLYGSLGFTGSGHMSDKAVVLGLSGFHPETIDMNMSSKTLKNCLDSNTLIILDKKINFNIKKNIIFNKKFSTISSHSNTMKFCLYKKKEKILEEIYFSIGGGFIIGQSNKKKLKKEIIFPYPFDSASKLLQQCKKSKLNIWQLVLKNEVTCMNIDMVHKKIDNIWNTMNGCIERGISTRGYLSGKLKVKRRARRLYMSLKKKEVPEPLDSLEWVNIFAMAVNEENAAGGKVVTAPTNGAAGIIPAVCKYYMMFIPNSNKEGLYRFFLTAGAIGILYKLNASISGADVGCQGEVGVACSMAAAGLVAALNGKNREIENAAEIGMEHNLGLTCDPVMGLVQIPCIERNAMGAVKAINAAKIAMRGKGDHKVSLDQVIETMKQTGKDMQTIYKETSEGGLAVNVVEC